MNNTNSIESARRGGVARAAKLSKKRRMEISRKASEASRIARANRKTKGSNV